MVLIFCVQWLDLAFYSCWPQEDRRVIGITHEMVMFFHDYEDDLDIFFSIRF